MLRQKSNQELFYLYKEQLKLRLSPGQLKEYGRTLTLFEAFLGQFPPTPELATSFVAQFSNRKPRTVARYLSIIRGFVTWLGDDLTIKVRLPRELPQYVEPQDVDHLLDTVRSKKTHKVLLLIELSSYQVP